MSKEAFLAIATILLCALFYPALPEIGNVDGQNELYRHTTAIVSLKINIAKSEGSGCATSIKKGKPGIGLHGILCVFGEAKASKKTTLKPVSKDSGK